jgi:predicted DNA binding CopG/RHH family protein
MDKDKRITIRISDEEKKKLEALAKEKGINLSTYLTYLIRSAFNKPPTFKI